jgi:hypothetical protein
MGWKIALSYLGSLTVVMGVALSYGFAEKQKKRTRKKPKLD